MVRWLQVKENFAIITGSAAKNKSVVAGQKLTKIAGFGELAKYMNQRHQTTWTGPKARSRFNSYFKLYKVYILYKIIR
jgi:hypothetical protein